MGLFVFILIVAIVAEIYVKVTTGSFDPRGLTGLFDVFRNISINTSLERNRKQNISKKKNKYVEYYYELVSTTLNNLEYSSTVEWFTFILIGISIVSFVVVFFMLQNVLVSLLSVFSAVTVGVTVLATMGKRKASLKLNAVLDALDLLCAYIERGTKVAVEENKESFDVSIRPYFEEFLQDLNSGSNFDLAIDSLNKKLGSAFDSFANKAKIYEKERLKGMDQIFKDIIDDNAVTREINIKKEKEFGEMNESFFMKILIVGFFIGFSFSSNAGMRYFVLNTGAGKILLALSFISCSLVFAYTQLTQLDISFGGGK